MARAWPLPGPGSSAGVHGVVCQPGGKGSDVNVAAHLLLDVLGGAVDGALVNSDDSDMRLHVPVGIVNPSRNYLAGVLRGTCWQGSWLSDAERARGPVCGTPSAAPTSCSAAGPSSWPPSVCSAGRKTPVCWRASRSGPRRVARRGCSSTGRPHRTGSP
ncbi:MAG: hypothetical protein ACM3ML_03715 [Micromonosporaceae bacterium]